MPNITAGDFEITWHDFHREPRLPPNPAYPDGIDLVFAPDDSHACKTELPYPAARCGFYALKCKMCGLKVEITTAGRADDPKSITLPCKMLGRRH